MNTQFASTGYLKFLVDYFKICGEHWLTDCKEYIEINNYTKVIIQIWDFRVHVFAFFTSRAL